MNTNRNRAIDALKGILILFIVIHHSQLMPFIHHGYLAVDVFFWIAGVFLMRSFLNRQETAFRYTLRRIKQVLPPYLIAFVLACILDYKHLLSFRSFDEFLNIFTPFSAFLTLTEELGPLHHSYVVLVGGWFLSVLIIGGFLLYSLLEYNEKLTTKVLLPFGVILGFTFMFHGNQSAENFSIVGAISFPLLRGFIEMSAGAFLYALLKDNSAFFYGKSTLFNILAVLGFIFLIGIMITAEQLDAYTVILIPIILIGLMIPDSWLNKAYLLLPSHILPTLGALSLEIYLIHSPVIHIVHSLTNWMNLSIIPWILALIDILVVILAALVLRKICNAPRLAHHRA